MAYPTHGAEFHERQSWKQAVVAASTANVTLATGVEDGDTLDGITLATGDRILLKDQSADEENGIYVVTAGAPVRAADFDAENEVWGAVVVVIGGTANEGTAWQCTTTGAVVLDTDSIDFTSFGGGGGGGSSFTPVVTYAESNTPGSSHATPSTITNIPFDTFYDVDVVDLSGILPAGLGLSYSGGVFTATDDGIWILTFGINPVAAPGDAGEIGSIFPDFALDPFLVITPTGNPFSWIFERTVIMHSAETFNFYQVSEGSSVSQVTYASVSITRIATSIS
jgi:hypothetical protein